MKAENIQRAGEIGKRLSYLEKQKQLWNDGVSFNHCTEVCIGYANGGNDNSNYEFLNFDVCKALALVSIDKEIKELEAELETL